MCSWVQSWGKFVEVGLLGQRVYTHIINFHIDHSPRQGCINLYPNNHVCQCEEPFLSTSPTKYTNFLDFWQADRWRFISHCDFIYMCHIKSEFLHLSKHLRVMFISLSLSCIFANFGLFTVNFFFILVILTPFLPDEFKCPLFYFAYCLLEGKGTSTILFCFNI